MYPWLSRAALQRSVAKIFYHAGFEEYQPSAIGVVTDLAADVLCNLGRTFVTYREAPLNAPNVEAKIGSVRKARRRFSLKDCLAHSLDTVGQDVETLEGYVTDDVERLQSKLGIMHERMKSHLAELLVSTARQYRTLFTPLEPVLSSKTCANSFCSGQL